MSSKSPACVCVSDIHWGLSTLNEAGQATTGALKIAENLNVPLCILGDLNDTKAVVRAEVMNSIIEILKNARVKIYILVGNHDKVHEKAPEHGLNYLRPYAQVVDKTCAVEFMEKAAFLPYQSSNEAFTENLALVQPGWTVFMHQGVKGAHLGEYVVDHSSVDSAILAPYNCISGHYHRHQTVGTLTYIGSPYTISFAEASDGPKGCMVINHDGTWERRLFPNIRKHVVVDLDLRIQLSNDIGVLVPYKPLPILRPEDIAWLKLRGAHAQLDAVDKKALGLKLFQREDYKLDLIYDEVPQQTRVVGTKTNGELMDEIIDLSPNEDKAELRAMWRELTCP